MGWEALALFAVLTICGAETGSKSYLLMLCGILGLFTICLFATKRYILGVLACAAVAFFCIAIFAGKIELFNNILIRLQSDNLTTGRADTWDTYIKYIDANWPRWLVGCGVGAGYVNQIAPHNTYLDFLYYYGIVGTLFWFALCINAVGKKQIPNIYIGSLSLICLLVMIVFLSSMIFFDFAFTIIFVVYALRTDFQKRPMKKRAA